jgi:hypothetical protein
MPTPGTLKLFTRYLILVDYILPIPLTILMFFLWNSRVGAERTLSILALGLTFGYTLPFLTTQILKLWEFTGPFRSKFGFYQHGFIYSSYLSLLLYLTWNPQPTFIWSNYLLSSLYCFLGMAFIGIHHDYLALSTGLIVNHTHDLAPQTSNSASRHLTPTAVLCFGLIGFFYLTSIYPMFLLLNTHANHQQSFNQFQLLQHPGALMHQILWLLTSTLLMLFALIPYCLQNRSYIRTILLQKKTRS